MPYLIDGHNLIGQLPDISLNDPNDEAKLVQKLFGFAARTGKNASARGSADDVMKARIKRVRDPGQWVIVSNDREVLRAARARKMSTLTSAAFAPQLHPIPEPQKAKRKAEDPGEASDVQVSPAEVEAWLKIFKE
jgi:hypothetical protein